ncbi:MAG: ADP-ribosylglycohydrolase family protein [Phycisphaerae bacterium]|nr:ADP-ribosylglycohydrolase family protein [Phycisphaerae bacterium]
MNPASCSNTDSLDRAWLSLEGLSLGDAFGECFFDPSMRESLESRELPDGPWFYTDDTMMAWSVVDVLAEHGTVNQDRLAQLFADRFRKQPNRGYGAATIGLLERVATGFGWRSEAARLFDGDGSMGNGGAMRAAPVGAYFADDLDRVVSEAKASAAVTHAHPEGQAGAIAIAVAAAMAWRTRDDSNQASGVLLRKAYDLTPDGLTRDGIGRAMEVGPTATSQDVAVALGSGQRLLASDTVPYAIWCAGRHLTDFEEALWNTAAGLGDVDTTCAVVGGIVALAVGGEELPREWLRRREPLEK